MSRGRAGSGVSRAAWGLALACAVAIAAGCAGRATDIRMEMSDIGREYVPGQVTSALQNAGYRQARFKSFKTNDEVKRELRVNDETEMRFVRRGTPTFVLTVNLYEGNRRVWMRLWEDGDAALSARGEEELDLVRAALREQFGDHVLR